MIYIYLYININLQAIETSPNLPLVRKRWVEESCEPPRKQRPSSATVRSAIRRRRGPPGRPPRSSPPWRRRPRQGRRSPSPLLITASWRRLLRSRGRRGSSTTGRSPIGKRRRRISRSIRCIRPRGSCSGPWPRWKRPRKRLPISKMPSTCKPRFSTLFPSP